MSDESKATGKDATFFQIILTSMKNKPDVDWAVVAEKAGYKDAKTASTRYGQIMKKLTGQTAGQAMSGATAGNTAKVTPKKAKVVKKEVGSGTNTTPSKVTKRAPKKTKKPEAQVAVFEDEEDENDGYIEDVKSEPTGEEFENGHENEEFVDADEDVEA